jgi:hypothetical protein
MKLQDVRKFAVKQGASVEFALPGGRRCVVDSHGLARAPGLQNQPDFNLEEEFEKASEFQLTDAGETAKRGNRTQTRALTRAALEALVGTAAPVAAGHAEEEE